MEEKRGRGRPTSYTPEIGEQIRELMAQGYSMIAAGACLGFPKQTVSGWSTYKGELFDEWRETLDLGQGQRQFFLEKKLLANDGNPTPYIFALKNAAPEDWREKREVEHSGSIETTTKEQRDAAVAAASRADG